MRDSVWLKDLHCSIMVSLSHMPTGCGVAGLAKTYQYLSVGHEHRSNECASSIAKQLGKTSRWWWSSAITKDLVTRRLCRQHRSGAGDSSIVVPFVSLYLFAGPQIGATCSPASTVMTLWQVHTTVPGWWYCPEEDRTYGWETIWLVWVRTACKWVVVQHSTIMFHSCTENV